MDITGDGVKFASKYMQQAAWVFEDLQKNVTQLKPTEITPDFTPETLGMLSSLMLAQSQYLFYKLANDKGMKADILSKISQQISHYFGQSFKKSQLNMVVKNFQNKEFAMI